MKQGSRFQGVCRLPGWFRAGIRRCELFVSRVDLGQGVGVDQEDSPEEDMEESNHPRLGLPGYPCCFNLPGRKRI